MGITRPMQSQDLPKHATTQWWRLSRVMEETGLSRSTIYRMMKSGTFPKSRTMTSPKATIWLQSEIVEWKANGLEPETTDVSDLL